VESKIPGIPADTNASGKTQGSTRKPEGAAGKGSTHNAGAPFQEESKAPIPVPPRPPAHLIANPNRTPEQQRELNRLMINQLDVFLDQLAVGHRSAMDQVVNWLTGYGDLDAEIRKSVEALGPMLQKWSIEICFLLRMRTPRRFNELKDNLPGIGSRTLSQRLKELEELGVVQRVAYAEVPVRVEYSLTPKGLKLGDLFLPVIAHLRIAGWKEEMERQARSQP
jgi:DNA-binding HxlR family transcriptional regulator